MDIEKVNSMDFGEFVDVFGNVIERCPVVAAAVWSQRPFSDADDLERHFSAFLDALPVAGKASGPAEGLQRVSSKCLQVSEPGRFQPIRAFSYYFYCEVHGEYWRLRSGC